MLAKEVREFYNLEVRVETTSVIVENIKVKFNKIVLSDGDDTVTIANRRLVYEIDKTIDGFRVKLYILNDVKDESQRIDYLTDDDYEIVDLDIEIYSSVTNKQYKFKINENIGEQVSKKVEIEVPEEIQKCMNYLFNGLEKEDLINYTYQIINKNAKLVKNINTIADISIIE